jgi:murein tripeptide amidase MpaA
MLNPDGVIIGNSRTSLSGDDLNRYFKFPGKLHPEISGLLDKAGQINNALEQEIDLFIDIHGHFKRKGSFMYGTSYPLHEDGYYKVRFIPKLMENQ